ncbi:MAG: HPr family phosphocarrier protein [Smithellaceae bacterium]|nr:HPr family phosphocarrier protein [Smithellaceae bacterium]
MFLALLSLYEMVEIKTFKIVNKLGLHARAAAKLVSVSNRYKAKVFLEKDGQEVNAKSLLGILTLACPLGSRVTVRAEGPDAQQALQEIGDLINRKFDEE